MEIYQDQPEGLFPGRGCNIDDKGALTLWEDGTVIKLSDDFTNHISDFILAVAEPPEEGDDEDDDELPFD